MTWPEDTLRPTAAPTPRKAPNLAVGYLLSVLLPGAGFTYIGLVGWHVGWIGILIALNVLGAVLAGVTSLPLFTLLPVLGWAAQLVQFGQAYARREAQNFRPDLENGVKIGLIAGHAVLNSIAVFGIVAAVILPNLLGARERANGAAEQAAAKSAYVQVMVAQVDGTLRDGPCPLEDVMGGEQIESCTVTDAASEEPQVTVTFKNGHMVQLP
ncbi:hypothetical protein [Deinococcus sedimenti]|uniref:DUF4333 domain-containing protein n=1 Tax=Deinococcus sedimenti TaxID=1867090 RepID=A0ABQ2S6K2_9DEIO|nr:hypothetical protein [Deinococcus sedimenti]GGR94193.1 hypothetical protein GCM10008960_21400 [Deinococcus sedimenti]